MPVEFSLYGYHVSETVVSCLDGKNLEHEETVIGLS